MPVTSPLATFAVAVAAGAGGAVVVADGSPPPFEISLQPATKNTITALAAHRIIGKTSSAASYTRSPGNRDVHGRGRPAHPDTHSLGEARRRAGEPLCGDAVPAVLLPPRA